MPIRRPLYLSYGLGRDSTAILVGWKMHGIRPDRIVFADVGSEKGVTYDYLPVINEWLRKVNFPEVTVVKYVPGKKVPYSTIEGNCTMNATLPSEAFGFGSCSCKWKIKPQEKYAKNDPELAEALNTPGRRIYKAIGYEATETGRRDKLEREQEKEKTAKKTAKKHATNDPEKYHNFYPLIEWGWDLEECKARIKEAGLPVPPKSSCYFCPNMRPEEVRKLTPEELGRIIRLEIAAEPYNQKIEGLWRKTRKRDNRPGSMTEFILREGLDFIPPTELPDKMPLNPNCQKAENGVTFKPPHRDITLNELLEQAGYPKWYHDVVEDELHRKVINSI